MSDENTQPQGAVEPASTGSAAADVERCAICNKPLLEGGSWIDDEEYGDVHEACLEEKQDG